MLRSTLLPLALVACKRDADPSTPTGDDDEPTAECVEDLDCNEFVQICEDGECVRGDRDDALDDASEIRLGDGERRSGVISPDGDVDWYEYASTGREWVSVRTFANGESALDTVVTVYAADGSTHARVDNYPAFPFGVSGTLETGETVSYDSVVYAWLPRAGSWFIAVEDVNGAGDPDFAYDVLVREAFGVSEADSVEDPGGAVELPGGDTLYAVGVVIEEGGDSDWIEVVNPVEGELEVWSAPDLFGSDASPLVRVYDAGEVVAEKRGFGDADDAEWLSWFEGRAGTFLVEAVDAGGEGSDDHWFPLFVRTYEPGAEHAFFGENVYEREVEPNEVEADAQPLAADDEGDTTAFRLQGRIDAPGDLDFFAGSMVQGEEISVRCWTERFGSLAALEVGLYADGAAFSPLVTAPDADDFYLVDVVAPSTGPLHLRVRGDGLPFGADSWYRCAVFTSG